MKRSVRDMELQDAPLMIKYFLEADADFLIKMGVDAAKLPAYNQWCQLVADDFARPIEEKQSYYVIWELDDEPVGHSNINKLVYGQEAFMHLHVWNPDGRQRGHGAYFVSESVNRYFEHYHLQNLFCEPSAFNPAPNRTLPKVGFELKKTYDTTPGWINFEQTVNRWLLTRERWEAMER
ncbi:MAG: GNAT family protein [Chloroflexota bacterium]